MERPCGIGIQFKEFWVYDTESQLMLSFAITAIGDCLDDGGAMCREVENV